MAVTKLRLGPIYTGVPGVYSEIDADQMANLSPVAQGVVAIVGDGEGGGAGGGTTIGEYSSPQSLRNALRGGNLLEAGLFAFEPSDENETVGGAVKVLTCKTNPATQASLVMANADGNSLTLLSQGYGQFANRVSVEKANDGVLPSATIEFDAHFEDETESYDEIGGTAWFSALYSGAAGIGYSSMGLTIGVDGAGDPDRVYAEGSKTPSGEATSTTWASGERANIVHNAANNGDVLTVYGVNTDGEPDSEEITLAIPAGDLGVVRWFRVTGAKLSAVVAGGNLTVEDETGNVPLTLTFGSADWDKGLVSESLHTPNLANLVVADRPVTLVADGVTTDPIGLRGLDPSGNAQTEVVTLAGSVNVASSKSWSKITQVETGGLDAARTVTIGPAGSLVRALDIRKTTTTGSATRAAVPGVSAAAFQAGDVATVTSSGGAADAGRQVTLYGVDTADEYQSEVLTLGAAGTATGTATWNLVQGAVLDAILAGLAGATLAIRDQTPATIMTVPVFRLSYGRVELDMPVAATTVDLVADAGTTRKVLVEGLDTSNAVARELVTLAGAVAVTTATSWNRIDRFYVGDVEAARTVDLTAAYEIGGGILYVSEIVDAINARDGWTGVAIGEAPASDRIDELDIPTVATYGAALPLNVMNLTKALFAKLTMLIRTINTNSRYVTATRAAGATGVPTDTVAPVYLIGGSEGTTTNAHWLAALAALELTSEPEIIVVLSDSATVHAALDAHLARRARTLRREAIGFVGLPVGSTKTSIKSLIQGINSFYVSACAQEIKRPGVSGTSVWWPPYMQATHLAGMFAGAEPKEPMTHKYARFDDVRQDNSWNPVSDADTMLDYGLAFVEPKTNSGYRWVRSITTYLAGANLAYIETSTMRATFNFIRNFREILEAQIGKANTSGTQANIQTMVQQALAEALEDETIVAWRNLTYTVTGDQIAISIDVAPAVPLNFIPVTAHLYTIAA